MPPKKKKVVKRKVAQRKGKRGPSVNQRQHIVIKIGDRGSKSQPVSHLPTIIQSAPSAQPYIPQLQPTMTQPVYHRGLESMRVPTPFKTPNKTAYFRDDDQYGTAAPHTFPYESMSSEGEAPVREKKKPGRKNMTDEEKAASKAQREANAQKLIVYRDRETRAAERRASNIPSLRNEKSFL